MKCENSTDIRTGHRRSFMILWDFVHNLVTAQHCDMYSRALMTILLLAGTGHSQISHLSYLAK